MPTLYSLTLATALANLRVDLNDTDNTQYRWVDAALTRAIDRALERLSSVEPDLEAIQVATIPGSLAYTVPAGSLWVDRVEYPAGQWPPSYPPFSEYRSPIILPPPLPLQLTAVVSGASGLNAGAHTYAYTWEDITGAQTTPSATSTITTLAGQSVQIGIPRFPDGTAYLNLFRSLVGASSPLYRLDFTSSLATTYLDGNADSLLDTGTQPPSTNTTGGTNFIRMDLDPSRAPQDATGIITMRYAKKHELDSSGTTLPERHWDALYKGAMAAAVDMYLANINDNFIYADGQLRDRVDDTKSVDAWRAWRDLLETSFTVRLRQIRDEQIAGARFTPVWGEKPLRWDRV